MGGAAFPQLAAALRGRPVAVVDRWLELYGKSQLRLRPVDVAAISGTCEGIVDALAGAVEEPDCRPGSPTLREAEKRLGFAGGVLASAGASGFDVAGWVVALREALEAAADDAAERTRLAPLCDWLGAVAIEGWAASREDTFQLHHRECLERGTPVVNLLPELPGVFLVGDPDRVAAESSFGRLLLGVVRVGARAVVIHAAGLQDALAAEVLDALSGFAHHRKVAKVLLVVAGLPEEAEPGWRAAVAGGAEIAFQERFEDAFTRAMARSGLAVVPRR